MAEQIEIPLDQIQPNPYQPRTARKADKVESIARSIAADRLLQPPMARKVADDYYQLAFGDTRFNAFLFLHAQKTEWFAENGYPVRDYSKMPLSVEALSDEDMYRYAVAENAQRDDISPIDEARAMLRAMKDFRYTSKQVGLLFGKSESTVRGTVRLLDLPESLREKLAAGEMTVGAARKVLSVKHLVSEDDMNKFVTDRTSGRSVDEIVQSKIENGGLSLITMWSRWNDGTPRGGTDLWPLSWTYKTPPYSMPTEKEFKKLWKGPVDIRYQPAFRWAQDFALAIFTIRPGLGKTWEQLYAENKDDVHPVIDLLKQLAEPPACTNCQYYLKSDGNHYCALKACWDRKFEHFVVDELQALSKKLDIKTYNSTRDGRTFEKLEGYNDRDKKWFGNKHGGLRLMIKKSTWKHGYTDSMNVCLVMTGAEAEKVKAAEAKKKEEDSRDSYDARWKRDNRKRDAYTNATRQFVLEQVCPVFAGALDGKLAGALVDALASQTRYNLPDGMTASHIVIWGLVWSMSNVDGHARQTNHSTPVQFAAKHLQGVAQSWGVKLPPDWKDIAARYEPDLSEFPECCVSAETEAA